MRSVPDLIIKGGTLVDGTGAAPRVADVAVDAGRITDVGQISGGGARVIDAEGLLVTPGWVDIHTHYDGQATWDPWLAPSSHHGVTTVAMGNCGVGFAPVETNFHDDLIEMMAAMKPNFLRLPGGNYLEGDFINERFNWKETIGPLVDRPTHRSPWNYQSSDGMGLLEFLEWCEDLKVEPVLAVYAGYSLKGDHVEPGAALEP